MNFWDSAAGGNAVAEVLNQLQRIATALETLSKKEPQAPSAPLPFIVCRSCVYKGQDSVCARCINENCSKYKMK